MDMTYQGKPVVFLDYEASSLFADSHPIEAGVAGLDGSAVAFLIAPHPTWGPNRWDYHAEKVHGIPRLIAEVEGISCQEACRRLTDLTRNRTVISDNRDAELMWTEALFDVVGLQVPFKVISFDQAIYDTVRSNRLNEGEAWFVIRSFNEAFKSRHRAGPDAERLRDLARCVLDHSFRDERFGVPGFGKDWENRIGVLR